jgi:uncharacterized protein (TIGR03435 family)
MKLPLFNDQQLRELMDRSFGSYRKPDHAKAACDSVLTRLQQPGTRNAEPEAASDSAHPAHPAMDPVRRTRRWQWPAVAAAVAAIVIAVILPTGMLQGAPAVLEDAEGKRSIQYGELVRPAGDMSAMLSMTDGPRVETRSMSEFSLERTDDGGTRIRLEEGGLIVDASAENRANLYVQTKDMTALVSGAVSLVKAEEEGSRIAAIGGEIRVQQGTTEKKLRSGEEVATSPGMGLVPVKEEVAWSRQAAAHVAMLQQSASTMPPSPVGRPKFAAASVRLWPSPVDNPGAQPRRGTPGASPTSINCLGVDGLLVPAGVPEPNGVTPPRRGRCTAVRVPISQLVVAAFASSPLSSLVGFSLSDRSGAPQTVQIEAVADDPERVTKGELQQMLQSLLVDRFKARVHFEMKEVDGYVLTIAKSGIKFKETEGEVAPGSCQGLNTFSLSGQCRVEPLVARLERALWGPTYEIDAPRVRLLDKTGLTGTYDIRFFVEDPRLAEGGGGGGARGPGGGGQTPVPRELKFSPPIPKAVEDQLGLHLEPVKVQVQNIVIDHLELPTEN